MGGDLDSYNSYAQRGNLPLIEHVVQAAVSLFPFLSRIRLMRTWGGVMDMTMDGSPIIGRLPVEGLFINGGWCYGGFKVHRPPAPHGKRGVRVDAGERRAPRAQRGFQPGTFPQRPAAGREGRGRHAGSSLGTALTRRA